MKKKLIAILSACLVLSSALISCGNDGDDDSSSKKKNKSSLSESDPKYNENDDEDETTTEEGTTESTTEEETESVEPTTEKATSGSGNGGSTNYSDGMPIVTREEAPDPAGGDIKGMWGGFESDGADAMLAFEDGGKGALYVDMSTVMYFKSDRSLWMDGITMGKNSVSYDGTTITVKMDADSLGIDQSALDELDEDTAAMFTQPILVLTRTGSADSSTLDGEYKFTGGIFSDQLTQSMMEDAEGMDKDSLRAIIKGEKMLMKFADVMNYTTSGTKLTVNSDNPIFKKEFNESSVEYTVDGDTLYLFDDEDENKVAKLDRYTF